MNQRAHKCLNQAPEAEEYKIPVSTPAIMRPGDKSAKETVPPVHPPCLPGAGEPLSLLRRPDGHGDSGQKGGPADRTDCPRHSEEIGHDPGEKRAHSLSQVASKTIIVNRGNTPRWMRDMIDGRKQRRIQRRTAKIK